MRSGYCSPRCFPRYGTGHRGHCSVAHRLISGRAGGAVPGVIPWWDPNGEGLCVWSAYQPRGAASLAASYTDLSGNGNNTGPGVAPTWDAVNGWTFNGINQYLTTTATPNCGVWSVLVRYSNLIGGAGKTIFGVYDTVVPRGTFLIQATVAAMRIFAARLVLFATNAPVLANGVYAISAKTAYRDGVAEPNIVAGGVNTCDISPYIGALNLNGAAAQWASVRMQALAIYDCTLTAPQVAVVTAAMALL